MVSWPKPVVPETDGASERTTQVLIMVPARTLFHAAVAIYHVWFNFQMMLLSVHLIFNVPAIITNKGYVVGMQFLSVWAEMSLKVVEFILYRMDVILDNIRFLGLQYATFHNVAVQQIFFWMALRADWAEMKHEMDLCNRLRNWSDIMFKYIVVPLTTMVSVNFWLLFAVLNWPIEDMNIIRDHVPLWLNHCLHTVIVLLNLGELVLEPRHFPLQNGVVGSSLLVLFYAAWICTIKVVAGKWPYPYFSNFNILQLRMYTIGNIFLAASSYVVAAEINKRIWHVNKLDYKKMKL